MDQVVERQAKLAAKAFSTISWAVDDFSIGPVEAGDSEEDSAADLLETARREEEEEKRVCLGVCSVSEELEDQEEVEEVDQVVEARPAHCPRRRRLNRKLV